MKWTRGKTTEEKMFDTQIRVKREENQLANAVSDDMAGMAERESRTDLLRWQQDLQDEVINLKMQLRNMEINETGTKWIKKQCRIKNTLQPMPPMLNETGISTLTGIATPLLSRNLINSNMLDEDIRGMLRRTCDTLVNSLAYYGEEWEAEFGNYSTIIRTIKNSIIPTAFRAKDGWTKKIDSTISKRFEGYSEVGEKQNQNKGILSKFMGGN